MKKQRMPKGWTEEEIRALAEYHDNLTIEQQVAEIESALADEEQTVMAVPTDLVPEIVKLITKGRLAQKMTKRATDRSRSTRSRVRS